MQEGSLRKPQENQVTVTVFPDKLIESYVKWNEMQITTKTKALIVIILMQGGGKGNSNRNA